MSAVVASKNTRYDLNPVRVQALISRQIANAQAQRAVLKASALAQIEKYNQAQVNGTVFANNSVPAGPEYVDPMVDEFCEQSAHFALVRVLEIPAESGLFFLVYGDTPDEDVVTGTGPFPRFEDAAKFFYLGGR